MQPEEETRQEEPMEEMPTEALEAPAVSEERTDKRKRKAIEEEVEDFVSEEAYSNWKKHYSTRGSYQKEDSETLLPLSRRLLNKEVGKLSAHIKSQATKQW